MKPDGHLPANGASQRRQKRSVGAFPLTLLIISTLTIIPLGFALKQFGAAEDGHLNALLASLETALCIAQPQQSPSTALSPEHHSTPEPTR